jgi:anti-anti-sigma factor
MLAREKAGAKANAFWGASRFLFTLFWGKDTETEFGEKEPTHSMVVDMVARELSPGITAITLTGRLVLGNRLTDIEHAIRKLVLDFSGVEFIDSAGIGVLAVCCGSMEREGGKVAVAGATGKVKELLELTHLDRVAAMYPDVASAHSTLSET